MRITIIVIVLSFFSCERNKELVDFNKNLYFSDVEVKDKRPRKNIEIARDTLDDKYLKTKHNINSPVKIESVKLVKNEYSSFKDICLTFKNISKKDIHAIKFQWYSKNSFDEPANLRNFYIRGESCGVYDDLLKVNKTSLIIFEEFSSDARQIVSARVYEVVFSDGTKWTLKNQAYLDRYLMRCNSTN